MASIKRSLCGPSTLQHPAFSMPGTPQVCPAPDIQHLTPEVATSPSVSMLTQRGQASVTFQPDSGLFNSLGAGVVKLTV